MSLLPMIKILASPEHAQSSAESTADAGAHTGEPDVQADLAAQDAQGAPGPGGRQE